MTSAAVASLSILPALLLIALGGCRDEEVPVEHRIPGADPDRGRAVVADIGCGVCHRIPRVRGAHGVVGPSLEAFGRRALIAGIVANEPGTLVRWVQDAPSIAPETGMPELPLSEEQALDVAAFLYTLR